jgi:hypothetical protein
VGFSSGEVCGDARGYGVFLEQQHLPTMFSDEMAVVGSLQGHCCIKRGRGLSVRLS